MRCSCVFLALLAAAGCASARPIAPILPSMSQRVAVPSRPSPGGHEARSVPPDSAGRNVAAIEFLALLRARHYDEAAARFDSSMARVLDAAGLRTAWESIEARAGASGPAELMEVIPRPPRSHVWFRCPFERQDWRAEVVLDEERRVSGLRFAPAPPSWSVPDYALPWSFSERKVELGVPELHATLTIPNRPVGVAVVLVHGSGPQDEDASAGPLGTGNKMFKDLAWGLASRGIAVLRYPKRTWAHPGQFEGKAFDLDDEVTADACLAVASAGRNLGLPTERVYLVAHSLGAAMAPRIAGRCPGMGGLVLMAGPSRTLDDVLFDQFRYLNGLAHKEHADVAQELEGLLAGFAFSLGPLADPGEELAFSGMRAPRSYWHDVTHYDPVRAVAATPPIPMLVMQGGRDYQVTRVDFEGWQKVLRGRSDVRFELYPSLDHRFMPGAGPATPADYDRPGHVEPRVIEDIATWLSRRVTPPASP